MRRVEYGEKVKMVVGYEQILPSHTYSREMKIHLASYNLNDKEPYGGDTEAYQER